MGATLTRQPLNDPPTTNRCYHSSFEIHGDGDFVSDYPILPREGNFSSRKRTGESLGSTATVSDRSTLVYKHWIPLTYSPSLITTLHSYDYFNRPNLILPPQIL